MTWISGAAREVLGLFVDDRGYALAILACIGLAWVLLPHFAVLGPWTGAALFAGLAGTLVVSALLRARR